MSDQQITGQQAAAWAFEFLQTINRNLGSTTADELNRFQAARQFNQMVANGDIIIQSKEEMEAAPPLEEDAKNPPPKKGNGKDATAAAK